jgi:hypothetical protein
MIRFPLCCISAGESVEGRGWFDVMMKERMAGKGEQSWTGRKRGIARAAINEAPIVMVRSVNVGT